MANTLFRPIFISLTPTFTTPRRWICHLNCSLSGVLRVLRASLIDKAPNRELFEKLADDGPEICENLGFKLRINFY